MIAARGRVARRRVDGVLLLDKPVGVTSNAALQSAKRLFAAEKAGHTGTLDPLASGLLPVCFGEATKFAHALLDAGKEYVATVRFGVATSTGDAEGEVVAERPATFTREQLEAVLPGFTGAVLQVPPRHAALKFEGRNYYEYARAGVEIPRMPRPIRIDAIEVLAWMPPEATLRVACGKGTYIRVLAEDIGAALESCAHLVALRRTAAGPFSLASAATPDRIESLDLAGRDALLLPVHATLAGTPELRVDAEGARALAQGRPLPAAPGMAGRHRCFDADGRFIGLVEIEDGTVRAVRMVRAEPPPPHLAA